MVDKVVRLTGAVNTNYNWTVPSDWTNVNTVRVWGGGAGGGRGAVGANTQRGGGGGGGCSVLTNFTATPGGNITYRIGGGAGGATATNTNGGNGAITWVSNTGAQPTTTAQGCLANGGTAATTTTGGAGGSTTGALGTSTFAGGAGGTAQSSRGAGGAGGSAADALAAGNAGGRGGAAQGAGGGGGGGTGGIGNTSAATGGGAGAAGGLDYNGAAGGGGGTATGGAGSPGANGGGGGGGGGRSTATSGVTAGAGGTGGAGTEFTYEWLVTNGGTYTKTSGTAGGGGGGGSGGGNANTTSGTGGAGAAGGNFGGGGGSGGGAQSTTGNGGNGGDGGIIITYTISTTRTLYWVGGTGTWDNTSTTNWSLTSGGVAGEPAPTSTDNVIFNASSGTGTITIGVNAVCENCTIAGLAGAVTFNFANNLTVWGSWSSPATNFSTSNTGSLILFSNDSQNITTSGGVLSVPVQVTNVGTKTLSGNFSTSSTFDFANGTLALGTFTLTCSAFSSSNSNTRTLNFGTGLLSLSGSSTTVLNFTTITGLTISGTVDIDATYSGSTGTRTFVLPSLLAFQSVNMISTAGTGLFINAGGATDTVSVTGVIQDISLGSFAGTILLTGLNVYGNFALGASTTVSASTNNLNFLPPTSTTKTINTATKTIPGAVLFNGPGTSQLSAAATFSGAVTLSGGTINLNNFTLSCGTFVSNNSNTRTLAFGTSGILNVTESSLSTVFDMSTTTNFTSTGTSRINISGSAAVVNNRSVFTGSLSDANSMTFYIYGTSTQTVTMSGRIKTLDLTNHSGTFTISSSLTVTGNFTGGTNTTYTGTSSLVMDNTSGSYTFTTQSRTLSFPISFGFITSSVATWTLQDNLTSTSSITLAAGTLTATSQNVTASAFTFGSALSKTLNMGSGTWTTTGTGTVWNYSGSNLTLNTGTSTIDIADGGTTATRTFAGGSLTYYNLRTSGAGTACILIISGSNTWNNISTTKTVAQTVRFTSGTNNSFNTFTLSGTVGQLVTLDSTTPGSQHTLTRTGSTLIDVDYLSIRDSNATPAFVWYAGNTSTSVSNNTGWQFTEIPTPSTDDFFQFF